MIFPYQYERGSLFRHVISGEWFQLFQLFLKIQRDIEVYNRTYELFTPEEQSQQPKVGSITIVPLPTATRQD